LVSRAKPVRINYPAYYYLASERFTKVPIFNRILILLGYYLRPVRGKFTRLLVNERIVEWPLVLSAVSKPNSQILDVGANESLISLHLASLGHRVTALDVSDEFEFFHPNLKFLREDIRKSEFPTGIFDYVIFLSTIEHVGLDEKDGGWQSAKKVLAKVKSWLAADGTLILSVPYGKKAVAPTQRVYDEATLSDLFQSYTIRTKRYFKGDQGFSWLPSDQSALANVASDRLTQGMCFVVASKA
jgi:2-polyprenyl-3-methyl-5-hydroxy-6-metoxy-1,4-benzoquinol methylase